MDLALEDDAGVADEEDSGTTADDEDTGAADEEDFGATADEDDGTAEEEDSFTLQHVVSGGSSLEDDGLDPSWLSPLSMTLDEDTFSTEEELSFPEVPGDVDEESSPQAASIAAKETATQPANNLFMDFLPLRP